MAQATCKNSMFTKEFFFSISSSQNFWMKWRVDWSFFQRKIKDFKWGSELMCQPGTMPKMSLNCEYRSHTFSNLLLLSRYLQLLIQASIWFSYEVSENVNETRGSEPMCQPGTMPKMPLNCEYWSHPFSNLILLCVYLQLLIQTVFDFLIKFLKT